MSSCTTLNSQSLSKYGSVSSLDTLRGSNHFGKNSQLSKQMPLSLENVPEGSSKLLSFYNKFIVYCNLF